MKLIKIINSRAPIRINDIGGWTDTWFAEHGKVLNIAVSPGVEVQIKVFLNEQKTKERVIIHQENFHETFLLNPDEITYSKNPMLEAAFDIVKIPDYLFLEINIFSSVPAGSSTGTSAAVSVSLLGALNYLTEKKLSPYKVAYLAHYLETEKLKLQSGIQDQICSALGGICYIDMYKYPHANVSNLTLSDSIRLELENRLSLIFLGEAHKSSEMHKKVIENLKDLGPDNPLMEKLRRFVDRGRDFLCKGDFVSFGKVMIENTEVQRELHSDLISKKAESVIEIAKEYKALGWKVNGAGGDGGSLTILSDFDRLKKREMIQEIEKLSPEFNQIPVLLSPEGLTIWEVFDFS
ncbi:MAG: GHMP kinase [Acidobacteriota bacterium]